MCALFATYANNNDVDKYIDIIMSGQTRTHYTV